MVKQSVILARARPVYSLDAAIAVLSSPASDRSAAQKDIAIHVGCGQATVSRRFGSIYQLAQSQSRISLRGPLFLLANSGCSLIALPKSRKPLRDMLLEWHFWTNLNHSSVVVIDCYRRLIDDLYEDLLMSIDIRSERLIGLDEAAQMIPGRDGGTVHPFTVGLWTRRGKRGVILESVLAGPRRCTSIEALARFLEAVTRAANGEQKPQAIASRSRRQAAKAVRQAALELAAPGA